MCQFCSQGPSPSTSQYTAIKKGGVYGHKGPHDSHSSSPYSSSRLGNGNSMKPHHTTDANSDSASSSDEYLEDPQTELNSSFEQYLEKMGLLAARDHQTAPDSTENAKQVELQAPISEEAEDNLWNQEYGSEQEVWSHTEYPAISENSGVHFNGNFNEEVYEEEHGNAQFQCQNETIADIVQDAISDEHMTNSEMASAPYSTKNAEQTELQVPISEEANLWNQEYGSEQEVWHHTEYPANSENSDVLFNGNFNEEVYGEEHGNAQFQCETGENAHCHNETIADIVQDAISDEHMANNKMASVQASDNESTARTQLQCNDNQENYIMVDQDTIYFNGQYYQRVHENAPMYEHHQQQYTGSSIGKMPRVHNHKAKGVRSQDPANTFGVSRQFNNQYERNGRNEKVAHPFTYLDLVSLACFNSPDGKVVPTEVYRFIEQHYEVFRTKNSNWKNSVRHQLSSRNPSHFVKEPTYGNVMTYRLADPEQARKRLMACVSANADQSHRVPQYIYDLIFSHEYAPRQFS